MLRLIFTIFDCLSFHIFRTLFKASASDFKLSVYMLLNNALLHDHTLSLWTQGGGRYTKSGRNSDLGHRERSRGIEWENQAKLCLLLWQQCFCHLLHVLELKIHEKCWVFLSLPLYLWHTCTHTLILVTSSHLLPCTDEATQIGRN